MNLLDQLKRDEGNVPYVYTDSKGYSTIGVGFMVDQRLGGKLYPDEIDFILRRRVERARAECSAIPQLGRLNSVRLDAVINMAYNLGQAKLLGFVKMLDALSRGSWDEAASEMLDSDWAKQVGDRANRLAKQMRTGIYQ